MILSTDVSAPGAESTADRSQKRSSSTSPNPERTRVVTPLNSLIRPQPWVNWLIVVFGLALWAGGLRLGWTIDRSDSGLKEVLGLRAGKATGLFAAICLLGVTQLSLVNLWYRTHSRKDFQGQYRVWIWSSLTWAVLFSAAISDWHLSFSSWLAAYVPGRLRPLASQIWLMGACILVATACRILSREMARTAATRWLLAGAAFVSAVTAILHLDQGMLAAVPAADLRNACGSLWPLLMASALLHHARYVIHVSNEALPVTQRPGRISPVVQQVWAEVLQMGPSRAVIAKSLAPRHLWNILRQGARTLRTLTLSLWNLIQRRSVQRRATRLQKSSSAQRRKDSAVLPVVAPANEPQPRSTSKNAAKSVKSA